MPVEGVTLEECVTLAKKVGTRNLGALSHSRFISTKARRSAPDRVNLENIRKGQFELVREEVLRNPDRAPDIGEPRLPPHSGRYSRGRSKVSDRLQHQFEYARRRNCEANREKHPLLKRRAAIRQVHGRGLVRTKPRSVSINLTDFEQTPIHRVFEMVKREAERYGVAIVGSEIVGLIPRRALELTSDFYLQLENFSPAQVLENRIEAAVGGTPSVVSRGLSALAQPFLDAVARPTAAPGGGSVAALAGALGASLGAMVAGISRKKKSQATFAEALTEALAEFQTASKLLAESVDRDAASFELVLAAQKLPKETPEERQRRDESIQAALVEAVEVPLEIARKAAEVFERLGQLEALSSPSMLSDIRVGRLMAIAAVRSAIENVDINLAAVTDTVFVARIRSESREIVARVAENPVAAR